MKQIYICFALGMLTPVLCGMFSQKDLSPRETCMILMARLEKKKFISEITYNSVTSRSPEYLEKLLTEIDTYNLEVFNKLDFKERCGSKLDDSEQKKLQESALKILASPSLAIFEEIYAKTKSLSTKQYKENVSRYKNQIQTVLKLFFKYKLITECTCEAFSQAHYFDELVAAIENDEANLKALESFIECITLVSCGKKLDQQQGQTCNASQARLLFLRPLKTFESISRTIEWLKKNNKILPANYAHLSQTQHFLEFYTALSQEQIDLFLQHYEHVNTSLAPDEKTTKKIYDIIRTYMSTLRKNNLFLSDAKKPDLSEQELQKALESIHLRTGSSDSTHITPRTGSPSPETILEEIKPQGRKISDPPSPAIDIKRTLKNDHDK